MLIAFHHGDQEAGHRHTQRHGQYVQPFQPRLQRGDLLMQILLGLAQLPAGLRLFFLEIIQFSTLLGSLNIALVCPFLLLLEFA